MSAKHYVYLSGHKFKASCCANNAIEFIDRAFTEPMRGGIVPSKRLHVQGNFEKEFVDVLSIRKRKTVSIHASRRA